MALNFGQGLGFVRGDVENVRATEELIRIGRAIVKEEAGAPDINTYPEGTLIVNMAENRLYVSVDGAADQPDALHLKLNETSGTNASDSSSGGHNGTATSASWTTGNYGNGFDCYNGGDQDTVDVTGHADFDYGDLTFEIWVKRIGDVLDASYFSRRDTIGTGNYIFGENGNGKIFLSVSVAAGFDSVTTTRDAADILPLNEWVHMAATIDDTNNTGKIYVNGVLEVEGTLDRNPSFTTDHDLIIGGITTTSGGNFVIDEAKVWKSVRTAGQIKNDSLEKAGLVWTYIPLTGAG